MLHTLLDVAISPIERFTLEFGDIVLPVIFVTVGVLVVAAITFFFVKKNKNKENKEKNKED